MLKNNLEKNLFKNKEEKKMQVTKETKKGDWLEQEEKNPEGNLTYKRKREFVDPTKPEKGLKYDYEKNFITYDKDGNLIQEQGRDYLKGTLWTKNFEWENNNIKTEISKVTEGKNKGHSWKKEFIVNEQGKVSSERITILSQGENPNKEPSGEVSQTQHFYDQKGEWIGKKWQVLEGPRKGKSKIEGEVPENIWITL